MSYFQSFPRIDYEYRNKVSKKSVDILRRYRVIQDAIESNAYETVTISENQSPQSLAKDLYGDPKLYWAIMLFNKIVNPFYEWAIPESKLTRRLDTKYPGVALFVTSNQTTDLDDVTVNTKTPNASYSIGETINIYDNFNDLVDTGTLYEYDRTTGQMKIDGVDSFVLDRNYYITDSQSNKKMYIGRKFDVVRDTLKYFLDEDRNVVSPYRTFGETNLINMFVSKLSTTISSFDINTVSIDQYEKGLNDQRRIIKLPDISVVKFMRMKLKELNKT